MKITNKSTTSEHIVMAGHAFDKVTILVSNGVEYSSSDRRIVAPIYGQKNIMEIYRSYKQAGIKDIQFAVDSQSLPEASSTLMLENFKADKKHIIDVVTGVDYSSYRSFQYLFEAYKIHPSEELASFLSRYLIQQIPLRFDTAEACLNHFLTGSSDDSYRKLLSKLQELEASHESELIEATRVSNFDDIVEVETFADVGHYIDSEKYNTYALLGRAGTGKTKNVLQPISKSAHSKKRIVYLSYLIPLVEQFCEMTDAISYKKASLYEIENADALGVVVNSSYKDHIASFVLSCDVLIIDEFEKVTSTVCSNSNNTMPREEVFEILSKAIKRAPKVVVADADITDTTLRWLKKLGKNIQVIKATDNPYKNVNVTIADKLHVFTNTRKQFKNEKVILFDTLKSLRLVMIDLGLKDSSGQPCEKVALRKKTLVITGANKGSSEQAKFLKNPSKECLKYDKIFASPCLASGYSIESDYTDNVNVMSDLTLGVKELINFSKRFRTSTKITFYLTSNFMYDYQPIQNNFLDSDCDLLNLEFVNKRKLFNSNQPLSMRWALKQLGFNVQILTTTHELLEKGQNQLNVLNGLDKESRIQAILDAPLTTQTEVDRLMATNQVGFQEQAMIKRFEIMRDYQISSVKEEDVLFDMSFTNKQLFKHVWTSQPNKDKTTKHLIEPAKILNSMIFESSEYSNRDEKLRLSRPQVLEISRKIYDNHEYFHEVLPRVKFYEECTQARATKLLKSLLTSLGYIWPKHGYNGNKNLVRIKLDDRALAFRNTIS